MKDVVILTATYNRAYILPQLYKSLVQQTNKNFVWFIVDDGSTDETKNIVDKMIKDSLIEIHYVYQSNGGKARALNNAFSQKQDVKVFAVVDSDDYLLPSAVDTIYKYLNKYEKNKEIGGFYFFYNNLKGEVLKPSGKLIVKDKIMTRYEYNNKYRYNDGCICYLNRTVKKYKYPEFKNEKYIGPTVLQMMMAEKYKIVFSPKAIGVADYLKDGLTKSGRKLRLKNPKGMIFYSKLMMSKKSKLIVQIKYGVSIWPYAKILNKSFLELIRETKRPILLLLTYLPGCILHIYWKKKLNSD